jgi:hypothetical protein
VCCLAWLDDVDTTALGVRNDTLTSHDYREKGMSYFVSLKNDLQSQEHLSSFGNGCSGNSVVIHTIEEVRSYTS